MTASWLRQMGWREVWVLVESGDETVSPSAPILGSATPGLAIDDVEVADLLGRDAATIVDLSLSRNYRAGHIAGAWFAIRSRLATALAKIRVRGTLVLTSEDGILAGLAVGEASALVDGAVRHLAGGNAAWQAAGRPLTAADARMADEPVDLWLKPYERPNDTSRGNERVSVLGGRSSGTHRARRLGQIRSVPLLRNSGISGILRLPA